jgi:hypothetical protein
MLPELVLYCSAIRMLTRIQREAKVYLVELLIFQTSLLEMGFGTMVTKKKQTDLLKSKCSPIGYPIKIRPTKFLMFRSLALEVEGIVT